MAAGQPGLVACIEVCDLLHRDSSTVSLLASRVCDLLNGVRKTLRDSPWDLDQVRYPFPCCVAFEGLRFVQGVW